MAKADEVRPFQVNIPEEDLVDLRKRLEKTRWPDKETVNDTSQGVPLALMQDLVRYWSTDYDWRRVESRLNALPQFITEIDGLDIHFIHVRSKHENALPVIITHGWPGSILEQMKLIEPLTDPTAYGGSEADAFHVVIPSMPGYGFSARPTTPGWDPVRIGSAWVELMRRLGYSKFTAQGGDWGALVSEEIARLAPPELLGIHTNLPGTVPLEIGKRLLCGDPPPAELSGDEKRAYEKLLDQTTMHLAYTVIMKTRPQTFYGVADSPADLAAWMIDHGDGWDQPAAEIVKALRGEHENLTRDDVLDNITLFWLTNTGMSSLRIYWENRKPLIAAADISVPGAITVFPGELYQAPRSWAEQAYHNLIYFNEAPKGGHFAAWEQPEIFANELRAAFKSLR